MTLQDAINYFENATKTGLLDDPRNRQMRSCQTAKGVIIGEARLVDLKKMSDPAYDLYVSCLNK